MRRLTLLPVLLLLACGPREGRVTTVRVAYQHEMVTLDPHAHNDGVTGTILSAVYEPLVTMVPRQGPQPCLAVSWSTPSPTVWRFVLRQGVLFHDGRPLSADDVVASFRRVRFDVGLTVATFLDAVVDVRKVEGLDNVVEVETRTPTPRLLSRLSMVAIAPQFFDPQRPLGTGPYRWVEGREQGAIVLRRFERYWNGAPALDEVRITFAASDDRLDELLRTGQLDVMAVVSLDWLRGHSLPAGWRVEEEPFLGTTLLGMNTARAPLGDGRVREAIDLAIDREELVRRAFPDRGARRATCLLPPGVPGRVDGAPPLPLDRARARRLLRESGVPEGQRLRLSYLGLDRAAVVELARQLDEVGLVVDASSGSYGTSYREMVDSQAELFAFGWSFRFADPADFLEGIVHTKDPGRRLGLMNGSGYSSPEVDRLIEDAARLGEAQDRIAPVRRALDAVASDRPYLPLYHHQRYGLVRDPFEVGSRSGLWGLPQEIAVKGRSR